MNYQSKNKSKCDFDLFFIFNNLPVIENGDTSLCRGTSEFFRGTLASLYACMKPPTESLFVTRITMCRRQTG